MKVLLDECITKHLKPHLADLDVFTVREMGWSGIKNGKLMALCVDNGFDLLLTIDKNLRNQQNLGKYQVAVVVLNSFSSKVEALVEFLPSFRRQLLEFQPCRAYLIER